MPLRSFCAEAFAFTTLAGNAGYGSADGLGRDARFNFPVGVAVSASGTVYVADTENCTIRTVGSGGATTTLAGSAGNCGSSDGAGLNARFSHPEGLAVDCHGNVYVADTANSIIRQITPEGVVTTLAGSAGIIGISNGLNAAAQFNLPAGLAVDTTGILYVADTYNNTIRMVAPQGTNWAVTTLAGAPTVSGKLDGTNGNARFYQPLAIAVDASRNLYVADSGNGLVRKISPIGTNWITTTLLTNSPHMPLPLLVSAPGGIAVDAAGNLYVANSGDNTLQKLTPAGTAWTRTALVNSTNGLAGTAGVSGSADGTTNALFNYPRGLALGTNNLLYVADSLNNTVRQVSPGGVVSTLAGAAGGPGAGDGLQSFAAFNGPLGLAADGAGNIYVADSENNSIRRVTSEGATTTLAGQATGLAGALDGVGTNASFDLPAAVAVDSVTNLYVADLRNNEIRKLARTTNGWSVSTVAGRAGTLYAGTITNIVAGTTNLSLVINGQLFYTNYSGAIPLVSGGVTNLTIIITNTPFITNAADHKTYSLATNVFTLPAAPSGLDGVGTNALFNHPRDLVLDNSGNLYVADGGPNGVRVVSPSGVVTTLQSSLGSYTVDPGVFGTNVLWYQNTAVAMDPGGNIFVADARNGTIRQIAVGGTVSTLAGSPGLSGTRDGTNAAARFASPVAIAMDSQTNLFVADQVSHTIRKLVKIGADWVVTTVGGWPDLSGSEDGIGTSARFNQPAGLAFDTSGVLYIADTGNNTIRRGQIPSAPVALLVQLLAGQALISWPASAVGFSLEISTNLGDATSWSLVTNPPALSASGSEFFITNSSLYPAAFYRLHRQ